MALQRLIRTAAVPLAVAAVLVAAPTATNAQITATTDYTEFLGFVGGVTVEDFGSSSCFPIGSTLNSSSNYACGSGGIFPSDIVEGVTFSVSNGPLLIDSGGGFTGGFLDGNFSFYGTVGPLQVAFAGPVAGFGFWTNYVGGLTQSVDISTSLGLFAFTFATDESVDTPSFFGWYANSSIITGATIQSVLPQDNFFNFALDDFAFGAVTPPANDVVPEPATITLFATGLVGMAAARRRRGKQG